MLSNYFFVVQSFKTFKKGFFGMQLTHSLETGKKRNSNEARTCERRNLLARMLDKQSGRFKRMWALHKKHLRLRNINEAQEQKELVFDSLYGFLIQVYDAGLLIYPEVNMEFADNFTEDLFAWFALTLGLIEQDEIAEMAGYITRKIEETIPGNLVVADLGLFTATTVNLN